MQKPKVCFERGFASRYSRYNPLIAFKMQAILADHHVICDLATIEKVLDRDAFARNALFEAGDVFAVFSAGVFENLVLDTFALTFTGGTWPRTDSSKEHIEKFRSAVKGFTK